MRYLSCCLLGAGALALAGCKKDPIVEIKEVEVPARRSWTEVRNLRGLDRTILSMGTDGRQLFLQQPYNFTKYWGQAPQNLVVHAARLPSDVRVRLDLAPAFFAYPAYDSLLVVSTTAAPLTPAGYVHLRRLDATAVRFATRYMIPFKTTAISAANQVLIAYDNNDPAQPITLLLATINPATGLVQRAQVVRIPVDRNAGMPYVRHIAALEDYFVADLGDGGLYRIGADGQFRQVWGSSPLTDAFYTYGGTAYAHAEWGRLLTSADKGLTWREYTGAPAIFDQSRFYFVGDSLVGSQFDQLYTLHWQGLNYRVRPLKADGLERASVTGMAVLRDSVYVATTTGLFARPLAQFFDKK
ncbi:hypothetical protein D3Y59_09760 [Hymenobacter oligotrophus]|uniref:DUF4221 domain-containing protein n=1 Tax=Hymenobacter oligotrophus TaxID=2319843 RepID=A0A3B7R0M4_9BACT|nr:hypothetical protein [Hymenobacter oligotrophus]AYA37312.1 hypothetical protein D3Y59_09760 [Hymenobacter oligotrophus]